LPISGQPMVSMKSVAVLSTAEEYLHWCSVFDSASLGLGILTATAESMVSQDCLLQNKRNGCKLRQQTTGNLPIHRTRHVRDCTWVCSGDVQAAHMFWIGFSRSNKIVVEGQVSCLGKSQFSPTNSGRQLSRTSNKYFINGKKLWEHTTNYLPLIKKLNPGLFS